MKLKEIKQKIPDTFTYRTKKFFLSYYGMKATHKGQRCDSIVWETEDKKHSITYDKGYIYAENEKGEVFAEVKK